MKYDAYFRTLWALCIRIVTFIKSVCFHSRNSGFVQLRNIFDSNVKRSKRRVVLFLGTLKKYIYYTIHLSEQVHTQNYTDLQAGSFTAPRPAVSFS